MSVNAKLTAAEAALGQSAETLSLCLQLRQRKTSLVLTRSGQWLTDDKEPRMGFSGQTVADAIEAGLLSVLRLQEGKPDTAGLSPEGQDLARETLEWLKAQNAPPAPPAPPADLPPGGDF